MNLQTNLAHSHILTHVRTQLASSLELVRVMIKGIVRSGVSGVSRGARSQYCGNVDVDAELAADVMLE